MSTNSVQVRDEEGKTSDDALHSRIEAKPTPRPVMDNAIARFQKLGLTEEEAKALLKG